MAPAPLFEIRGLTIEVASRQGETPLIEDVNLILRPGESIGSWVKQGPERVFRSLPAWVCFRLGCGPRAGRFRLTGPRSL